MNLKSIAMVEKNFFILSRCDFEITRELINVIYSDIHSMFKIPNTDKMITISSGMALHSNDLTVKGFVKKADDNLYLAKQNGKDIIYFENSPMV